MSDITVFKAKTILTMDPNRPKATHVAVQDGRILAVGGPDCADAWGPVRHDDTLADTVLMPGLVEGHAHMMAGAIWDYTYAGYHDRIDPDGTLWKGLASTEAVVARFAQAEAKLSADAPLVGWGFDPIFLPGERLSRAHLDRVSPDRPIAIIFSNFHLMCVNSAALALVGYDAGTNVEGVVKGPDGAPTGELQEMAAMFPIMRRLGIDFRNLSQRDSSIRSYAKVATRAGVTTVTDLFSELQDEDLALMQAITGEADYPLRIVPALGAVGGTPSEIADRALRLREKSTDKLRLGAVKLMTDGSIQGWTARVKWPGYVGGKPNGIWNLAPDQIRELCVEMHARGVQMHIHVNGDEASEVVIDALDAAMRAAPWPGARHVLQHGQLMGADQFRRCAEMGLCVNLFANHLWYFGDQHVALTVGRDRADRMDGVRAALDAGVPTAIHSDAPVTPMGPLFTAWCAVNRRTMSGEILGEAQQITVDEALRAITLGAAYTLRLDDEIGSIETGKRADFAILGADPQAVAPADLKDVPVLGTVFAGRVHLL
ncbi:amidohydrolase [Rhodobacteraceae bacterium N5(2021)]|uniref:Amidohydrolase n=1 Tax=Gymnodinialimonas phycosphaerae TaxID=2841589 RepID=A0A975TXW8_9RHOB|nr:amidohydrolase [Gymnodinialimonas phycosphaerae]MBY4893032.1 amidohydrolase [Gymnodinialimonas phycosphaerae]